MIHKILIIFFLTAFASYSIIGQDLQNLSAQDLKSINVDQLTDEQVQQFLNKAQESGLTLEQLELAAQQRGMPSSQIAKLRTRIRQLQLSKKNEDPSLATGSDRLRDSYSDQESNEYELFTLLKADQEVPADSLLIFGLDIFRNASVSFEPSLNVATPKNYELGAGDEIIIDVYGASEITYQQVISPDGNIIVSGVGPINLAGITVEEARKRIFNRLASIYSGIRGSNPNTFIQVSVGKVRSIKVNVVGNVIQPGTYTLSSFASAFNALYFSGGPTLTGSLRDIEVYRKGRKIATLDVYEYLFEGDFSQNPQLLDQDVIVVNPYLNRVKLAGSVKNPAIYELKEGETVLDLIELSGGFTGEAYKESLTIDRFGTEKREIATINKADFEKSFIQDGDSIYIEKVIHQYDNRVKIEGAVKRPGFYQLNKEMTLTALIEQANGFREDVYKERGNIIRLNENLTLKNLTFDIKEVMSGNQDVLLSPNDIIIIPSIFDIEQKKMLTLQGAVKAPGMYPYVDGLTIEDLISIGGGFTEEASTSFVEVARRITDENEINKSAEVFTMPISKALALDSGASNFVLQPFDLVIVKSSPNVKKQRVVKIEGEVKYPGYYALSTNEELISDIIERAGGLTKYGYPEGASLIRQTNYFRTEYEKAELDALIEVKRKKLEERYGSTESSLQLIKDELSQYEQELTENIKKRENSDELEASIFRSQQLRKVQVRDSITGAKELVEQEGVGIELNQILSSPGSPYDLILRDGDLLSVPRKLQTVKVQGQVLFPNTIRYTPYAGLKKYVSAAGGFSDNAKKGKSYVVYANGTAKKTRRFLWINSYPKVLPGADIVVPKKSPATKLSITQLVAITSSLATLALVINQLSN